MSEREKKISWDGCDAAIIGTVFVPTVGETVLAYSYNKLVCVFMDQGMDYEEAMEWVDFNLMNTYLGPFTPIIVMED